MGTQVGKSFGDIKDIDLNVSDLGENVEGIAQDFVKKAETTFEGAAEKLDGVKNQIKSQLFDRFNISKESIETGIAAATKFATKMLKEQPLAVAGIALGVGIVFGMMVVGSMSRKA